MAKVSESTIFCYWIKVPFLHTTYHAGNLFTPKWIKILIPFHKMYNPLQEAEYLFSIRSLLDERVRLCSGGSDRYATSRLTLPYHIQVYNFLPRKTAKLNLSSGQSAPSKIFYRVFGLITIIFLRKNWPTWRTLQLCWTTFVSQTWNYHDQTIQTVSKRLY